MGRLSLDIGRYGDANDFAQIMLVGLAFWCFIASAPKRSILGKIVPFGCIVVQLFAFAKTGSRGGVIGLFLTALILFIYSSAMARLKLLVVLTAAVLLCGVFLPHSIMLRYRSILTDDTDIQNEQEFEDQRAAAGSREGRIYLLKTSLRLTLTHPLTGVGLGMFPVAENDKARAAGRGNGSWHETHNLYTQISSEAGIPALIFFLMAMVRAMRDLSAIRKGRHPDSEAAPTPEQRHMAFWVNIACWSVITSGLFLSVAFTPELQFLFGLMAALSRSVHQENALPQTTAAASAAPAQAIPARPPAQTVASYLIPKTGY